MPRKIPPINLPAPLAWLRSLVNFGGKLGNDPASLLNFVTPLGKVATKLGDFATSLGNVETKLGNFVTPLGNFGTKQGNFVTKLGNCLTKLGNCLTKLGNFIGKSANFTACVLNMNTVYQNRTAAAHAIRNHLRQTTEARDGLQPRMNTEPIIPWLPCIVPLLANAGIQIDATEAICNAA